MSNVFFSRMSAPRLLCAPAMFALAMGLAPAAVAQSATTTTTTVEPEVVVTAPIEGSRIDSLQGAEILGREEIVETLNGGLGDTLDSKPGIATTFFGAGASRPIIRGLGEDRVRVLQNGIGAIDASTASPDHAVTSDGLDAERIEVLRGAAALAYGGNAVGGVVNVIDQSIPTRPVTHLKGAALAGYSTVDHGVLGDANVSAGLNGLNVRLSVSGRETDDYDTPIGRAPNSFTSLRNYGAGASLAGDWGFSGLAVKRTTDNYGLPPEAPGERGGRIELEQTRVETRGDIKISAGPFDRLDFGAQHSSYQHTEFESSGLPGTRFESDGYEGRVEIHNAGERLKGAVGAQISDVDFAAIGEESFITPTNTTNAGLFVVQRWDTGRWGLEGGARTERTEIDNRGGGKRTFDSTSVSAGAFVRPAPNWFLGATLARTERAPSQFELFSDGPHLATQNYEIGNAALKQEVAKSLEASARYTTDAFRFELNAFRIEFDDYIALLDRGDVFFKNEDLDVSGFAPSAASLLVPAGSVVLPVFAFTQRNATFTGGELSLGARLFEAGGFTVSGDAAFDLVRASFDGGGRPARIPPHTTTLGLKAENAFLSGRVEVVDTAAQNRVAVFETRTPGYTFVNAGLTWRPGGEEGALSFRLDGRNLTDELGRVHASFLKDELPLPGRSVRLTMVADF